MSKQNNMFFLSKIVDYWDGESISRWSLILSEMSKDELLNAKDELKTAVIEHTKALPDELLQRVAYIMMDDLYKSANVISFWSDYVYDYLDSTASVFLKELSNRGFSIHYVVDNIFDDMERPLTFFHTWYAACGIMYQCPQLFSKQNNVSLMDARQMCQGILKTNNGNFHYVLLDTDCEDNSFDVPVEQLNSDKVVTIIRTEAAEPGSKIMVFASGEQFQ
jgi:hypothetical protein